MADFRKYYPTLAKHEGGYANDPRDNGGETYKGVARKIHPNWLGWQRVDANVQRLGGRSKVKNNTIFNDPELDKLVYVFFEKLYWIAPSFNIIKNQSLAEILADWKINGGFGGSRVQKLQVLIGTTADGDWGKYSSQALNEYASNRVNAQKFFDLVVSIRDAYYRSLSDFWVFGKTWINRLYSNKLVFNKRNALYVGGVALCVICAAAYWTYNKKTKNKNQNK